MDNDRQKPSVYDVEESILDDLDQRTFKTVQEMQDYVNDVLATDWWKGRSQARRATVVKGKDTSRYACIHRGRWTYYYGRMYVGPIIVIPMTWANKEYILLHELAHLMTPVKYDYHGKFFCKNYLALLDKFMGGRISHMVKIAFQKKGLRYV